MLTETTTWMPIETAPSAGGAGSGQTTDHAISQPRALGAYGFAAMMRAGAYDPADAEMATQAQLSNFFDAMCEATRLATFLA